MRPDPILDDQIESSGMKTPIDLQGFEHLLPLLNTPTYTLQEINPNQPTKEEPKENIKPTQTLKKPSIRFCNSNSSSEEIKPLKNLVIKRDFQPDLPPIFDVVKLPNPSRFIKNRFGPLKSNSNWIGHQRSGNQTYPVSIKFLDFDLGTGNGAGLLEIDGLTEKWPKLVTFFDIEIVGRGQHDFSTKRWGANHTSDEGHWSKFPFYNQHKSNSFKSNDKVLFMRWKERFLDGNPRGKEIEGASFAGFYYACLDLSDQEIETSSRKSYADLSFTSSNPQLNLMNSFSNRISTEPLPTNKSNENWCHAKIKAFYYHAKSEPYQELNLRLENSSSALLRSSATYQFC